MKFLVVGLGSIGLRHAKNLQALGHEVYSFDPFITCQTIPTVDRGDGYKEKFDGIIIASPTISHLDYLAVSIENNCHVFVEKPIASFHSGVAEILAEAKRRELVVMVGNMLRFHPNVKMAKWYIVEPVEALFKIFQRNTKDAYLRDGVLLNWGAHEIDLALYLLGPAKVIAAQASQDRAKVRLDHECGAGSIVLMDYVTEPEVREFEVHERDGRIHNIDLTLHNWDNIYIEEMRSFIKRIEGEKDGIGATGEEGLATLKLINDAQKKSELV